MRDPRKGKKYRDRYGRLVVFLWTDPEKPEMIGVKGIGKGASKEPYLVHVKELTPVKPRTKKPKPPPWFSPDQCPTCQTPYPHYRQDVECPGCGGFGEWYSLSEMSDISLKVPFFTPDGFINGLDLRFEDYPKGSEEEKARIISLLSGSPFYARFPGSKKYLIFDGSKSSVDDEPPTGQYIELPNYWWDYAGVYLDQQVVKKPKKLRIYD
jgi:hypothetical protein